MIVITICLVSLFLITLVYFFSIFSAEAEKALTEAKERGDTEAVDKFERRLVKVSFYSLLICCSWLWFYLFNSFFLISVVSCVDSSHSLSAGD